MLSHAKNVSQAVLAGDRVPTEIDPLILESFGTVWTKLLSFYRLLHTLNQADWNLVIRSESARNRFFSVLHSLTRWCFYDDRDKVSISTLGLTPAFIDGFHELADLHYALHQENSEKINCQTRLMDFVFFISHRKIFDAIVKKYFIFDETSNLDILFVEFGLFLHSALENVNTKLSSFEGMLLMDELFLVRILHFLTQKLQLQGASLTFTLVEPLPTGEDVFSCELVFINLLEFHKTFIDEPNLHHETISISSDISYILDYCRSVNELNEENNHRVKMLVKLSSPIPKRKKNKSKKITRAKFNSGLLQMLALTADDVRGFNPSAKLTPTFPFAPFFVEFYRDLKQEKDEEVLLEPAFFYIRYFIVLASLDEIRKGTEALGVEKTNTLLKQATTFLRENKSRFDQLHHLAEIFPAQYLGLLCWLASFGSESNTHAALKKWLSSRGDTELSALVFDSVYAEVYTVLINPSEEYTLDTFCQMTQLDALHLLFEAANRTENTPLLQVLMMSPYWRALEISSEEIASRLTDSFWQNITMPIALRLATLALEETDPETIQKMLAKLPAPVKAEVLDNEQFQLKSDLPQEVKIYSWEGYDQLQENETSAEELNEYLAHIKGDWSEKKIALKMLQESAKTPKHSNELQLSIALHLAECCFMLAKEHLSTDSADGIMSYYDYVFEALDIITYVIDAFDISLSPENYPPLLSSAQTIKNSILMHYGKQLKKLDIEIDNFCVSLQTLIANRSTSELANAASDKDAAIDVAIDTILFLNAKFNSHEFQLFGGDALKDMETGIRDQMDDKIARLEILKAELTSVVQEVYDEEKRRYEQIIATRGHSNRPGAKTKSQRAQQREKLRLFLLENPHKDTNVDQLDYCKRAPHFATSPNSGPSTSTPSYFDKLLQLQQKLQQKRARTLYFKGSSGKFIYSSSLFSKAQVFDLQVYFAFLGQACKMFGIKLNQNSPIYDTDPNMQNFYFDFYLNVLRFKARELGLTVIDRGKFSLLSSSSSSHSSSKLQPSLANTCEFYLCPARLFTLPNSANPQERRRRHSFCGSSENLPAITLQWSPQL